MIKGLYEEELKEKQEKEIKAILEYKYNYNYNININIFRQISEIIRWGKHKKLVKNQYLVIMQTKKKRHQMIAETRSLVV